MRFFQLHEDRNLGLVINLAKKVKAKLSWQADHAIETWQHANWDTGKLERAFQANGDMAHEITRVFEPVRQLLKKIYGTTIKLYRGQRAYTDASSPDRQLFSWTGDPKVARQFTNVQLYKDISDDDIQRVLDQYARTGFASLGRKRFVRMKTDPTFFMIYQGRDQITDGDDLEELLRSEQAGRRRENAEMQAKGTVITADVPIDTIVWVTNDFGSKEFICRFGQDRA